MSLKNTFIKGANTIFSKFKEAIHYCDYEAVVKDDGFSPKETILYEDSEVIFASFSERDVQFLSFSSLIQPTDIKGIVRSTSINSHTPTTEDVIHDKSELDPEGQPTDYHIIAFQRDPMNVICILLLRGVQ